MAKTQTATKESVASKAKTFVAKLFNLESMATIVSVDCNSIKEEKESYELPIVLNLQDAYEVPASELRNTSKKSMKSKKFAGVVKYTTKNKQNPEKDYFCQIIVDNFNIANVAPKDLIYKIAYQIHRQVRTAIKSLAKVEEEKAS